MDKRNEKDFENVLQDPELGQEIGADELAVHTAGLIHPNDVELVNILAEDWDSVPDHKEEPVTPEDALAQFLAEDDAEAELLTDEPTQVIPTVSEEVFYEEAPLEAVQEEGSYEAPKTRRKGRPKWKKGAGLLGIPHMVSTVIWLAITVMIGVSLGRVLWVCCADIMSFGKPQVTAYITVTEEDLMSGSLVKIQGSRDS